MKILREYLGGDEIIDLDTDRQRFQSNVLQRTEAETEIVITILEDFGVYINASGRPEHTERYTVIE